MAGCTSLRYSRMACSRSAAHRDALACLGANLHGEALPEAAETWKAADGQLQGQFEQERRAEEGK